MRNIIIALVCFVISNANALDFHFGNRTVPLTTVKHTIPSLNVRDAGGTVHYGALFNINDYNVPANVVHVRDYDGVEYFLSPWCDAGYYPSSDTNECVPCGYGHYCTGGNHRESCTYGIIACNTTTASFDPPMPAGTDGMYNRALTMDEINQYVPVTDISMYDTIYMIMVPIQTIQGYLFLTTKLKKEHISLCIKYQALGKLVPWMANTVFRALHILLFLTTMFHTDLFIFVTISIIFLTH